MKEDLTKFQWKTSPEGQLLLDELVAEFFVRSSRTEDLRRAMVEKSGTRFFDWIDHLQLPVGNDLSGRLQAAGFSEKDGVWEHKGAIFPRIKHGDECRIVLKVESVADFLATHNLQSEIEGIPFGQFRLARAWDELRVVERHGFRGFSAPNVGPEKAIQSQVTRENFRARRRDFGGDDTSAFRALNLQIDEAIDILGRDWTCDLLFAAERDFWMRRNRAGRVQKARQDCLGLGWANHDHHTYRCRRKTFHHVIGIFEKLGFTCRERFYAGAQAGWGAQIVEHEATGVTIFADVDMSAEEVAGDFAHEGFTDKEGLGTVGLWCELHGESLLEAGMHHLEAQFDFDSLRDQLLEESGIGMMKPFTDFAWLRQQFSEGERWPVAESRLQALMQSGDISEAEADAFRREGAVGSHLENLERNDGFKGFNQTGISDIIERTDARKLAGKS
ncbi:MAG: hypothetical protein P1V20_28920 [Verrucomicrobiales bacterium]|nr:hypothetical protein [Verrucomicrobiales bacterium]